MDQTTTIEYASLDDLYLDPINPRLGRAVAAPDLSQERVLDRMRDWSLEELALSFVENGFWPQEALICVVDDLYGRAGSLVVIEGNRRLAALKYLRDALDGRPINKKWAALVENAAAPPELFEKIPFIRVESRERVAAYIGFRHVTGIKEWKPAEKAQYVAHLVEDLHMTYIEVMRKLGSKTPTVRQNYISYRLLLQMEDSGAVDIGRVEDKFSVLYLSLRTRGVQRYLEIDIQADPERARAPVPAERMEALAHFAEWLFGTDDKAPIVRESRDVDRFGRALESPEAVEYLENNPSPNMEVAYQIGGGDLEETVRSVLTAADSVEQALRKAHLYTESDDMRRNVGRLRKGTNQLYRLFPEQ